MKLVNSPRKINHHFCKTAPKFNTSPHNASRDPLNKHMCCDFQSIAETHKTKKKKIAASLPPRQLSRK